MKKLIKLLILILFVSCGKEHVSDSFELRQLVNDQYETTTSSGTYFLIAANWGSSTTKENIVKMFANIDGYYKYIECDIKNIRIKIDNSIKKPFIKVKYWSDTGIKDNEHITSRVRWGNTVLLNCPERFLPEKLLNIELKQY